MAAEQTAVDMGYTYQHECPQCGAPIELDETDHLLQCAFCNTSSYLAVNGCYRFVLPSKDDKLPKVYVPYLRFKGAIFSCFDHEISHRLVDLTHLNLKFDVLPISLGLRPQAMKMKFASTITDGRLIRSNFSVEDVLDKATSGPGFKTKENLLHQVFIGDTLSIIYLPLTLDEKAIFDGVTMEKLSDLPENYDLFAPAVDNAPPWKPDLLATICPQCGWNLEGESDSLVLLCKNCHTAWKAKGHGFERIEVQFLKTTTPSPLYLPFWTIEARSSGIEIKTFGDFIRQTNQPRVTQKNFTDRPMNYWSPAFKIRPKTYLRLAGQLTLSQPDLDRLKTFPKEDIHPVTLPDAEALQSLKLTLANCAILKKNIFPTLPDIIFSVRKLALVFVPFCQSGYGLYQEEMKININKQHLKFGRKL